jgi:DNA-binding transcriptional LysR family regulator
MNNSYKKNKLLQMRGFCTVIEEGSILRASLKMNTAHSNVSLQISSLERDLEISLFKREKQRLIPTPEALRLYKICKKSLEDIDMIFDNTISSIKQNQDNVIKLAGHSYMLSHILPPYFKKMIAQNKDVKFELHNIPYQEGMDLLEHGIIDFGVYPAKKKDLPKHIEMKELYKCTFGLAVEKTHPLAKVSEENITWNMIAQYDFLTLGKGVTAQGAKSAIAESGVSSRFTLYNGTWEICTGMINEGLTIGGADAQYLKPFKKYANLIIKECPTLLPEYKFFVLTNRKTSMSKSSNELMKLFP